ncbi:MAG: ankyrin repeat domain-containing protein [Parvularculaceae bacterium]
MLGNFSLLPHGDDAMVPLKRMLFLVLLTLSFATMTSVLSTASDLTEALKLRDIAKVRGLLAAGADPNEKVRRDYPLNIAAAHGPAEMVGVLLDAGAALEQPGRDGLYPLHNAIMSGQKDIVTLLLQRGAVVDARDKLGRTPLVSFAAMAGSDIEIAKMLLAAGANPNIESAEADDSPSALQYAAETGDIELDKLLIAARADVNHKNLYGWTPLHQAVQNVRPDIVRLLVAHGADVNLANKLGKTPLSLASNDEAMKQLLVAAGAK